MALGYLIDPFEQFVDVNGNVIVGGTVEVYTDKTERVITYKDFNGHQNTWPIVIDTTGSCVIIADNTKTYDIVVKDRDGHVLIGRDNVTIGQGGGSGEKTNVIGTDDEIEVFNNGNIARVALADSLSQRLTTMSSAVTYMAQSKQDKLIEGDNISITDSVISVTGLQPAGDYATIPMIEDISEAASSAMTTAQDALETANNAKNQADSAQETSVEAMDKADEALEAASKLGNLKVRLPLKLADEWLPEEGGTYPVLSIGSNNTFYSDNDIILGHQNNSTGANAYIIGVQNTAGGHSAAIGDYAKAYGDMSVSIGHGVIGYTEHETVVGHDIDCYDPTETRTGGTKVGGWIHLNNGTAVGEQINGFGSQMGTYVGYYLNTGYNGYTGGNYQTLIGVHNDINADSEYMSVHGHEISVALAAGNPAVNCDALRVYATGAGESVTRVQENGKWFTLKPQPEWHELDTTTGLKNIAFADGRLQLDYQSWPAIRVRHNVGQVAIKGTCTVDTGTGTSPIHHFNIAGHTGTAGYYTEIFDMDSGPWDGLAEATIKWIDRRTTPYKTGIETLKFFRHYDSVEGWILACYGGEVKEPIDIAAEPHQTNEDL